MGLIGRPLKRVEDGRLLTGNGRYVADLARPHMLHAAVLRSPHSHARVLAIDTRQARAMRGVVECITGDDLEAYTRTIPMRMCARDALVPYLQLPLARGKVRYAGEAVAVIAATDRYLAEDACDAIRVEYEALAPVVDPETALRADAPRLHERGNIADDWTVTVGDVDRALQAGAHVIRERFRIHRHTGVPLETRGLLAEFDRGRARLTVWGPTKVPYFNRRVLAEMLALEEDRIHFIEPDVGGGFGIRGEFYPEDFLVPYLALRTGRPVRWIEGRREHFLSANHSREQIWDLAVAARPDGTLLGIDAHLVSDMGAYIRTHGSLVAENSAAQFPGPYRIPSYRCRISCVMTSKTPVGTARAPAVYGSAFARERALDLLAERIGMDPVALRERNLVRPADMPYAVGTRNSGAPVVYQHGDFPGILRRAVEASGWSRLREQVAARNAGEPPVRLGVGLACVVELSRFGPFEAAKVVVSPSGRVHVYTGATSLGQGHETSLAQVCADALDVPFDDITVHHGDTSDLPYAMGTYACRFGIAAAAVWEAASQVRTKVLQAAAVLLEVDRTDLVLADGRVSVVGVPDRACTLRDIARALSPAARSGPGGEALAAMATDGGALQAIHHFKVQQPAVSFSAHIAVVAVDTSTGVVSPQRYVLASDVGRIVNPLIVEGQLVGGVAQGLGGALLEELVYDDNGQLLNTTFMDYGLPTAGAVPPVDLVIHEGEAGSPGVSGVHGVGEVATAGAGAALASAVASALGGRARPLTALPLKPASILALFTTPSR
jgi:CO/xanthine dehydrogenase Mo-binding subunit